MKPKSLARKLRGWFKKKSPTTKTAFQSVAQLPFSDANALLTIDDSGKQQSLQQLLDRISNSDSSPEFPSHIVSAAQNLQGTSAERLTQLRFTLSSEEEISFDKRIDWQFDPTSDPARRWAKALHRHQWLVHLAEAFRETKSPKYADIAGEILLDWIEENPLPPTKDEKNVAWTLMGAGIRAMIWPDALELFVKSQQFKEQVAPRMLLSLHDHAEFLAAHQTHLNHLLREANGLLHIGLRYPEFLQSRVWRQVSIERLEREIDLQINKDGSHIELSPAYQWLVAEELESTRQQCEKYTNFDELRCLKANLDRGLKQLYSYLLGIATPAGTWPQIKEGFYPSQDQLRSQLLDAGQRDNNPNLVWVATNGSNGTPPKETTISYPQACCTIFRSDWSPEANYLIFQNGPFGGPHGHEDALSIELWAGGAQFLVDPGTSSYNINDPFRHYFTSSNAHNTVVADGKSQVRRWSKHHWWPKPSEDNNQFVVSTDESDWAAGTYDGPYAVYTSMRGNFKRATKGIKHRRQIMFIRNSYWILIDDLSALKPTVFERKFQCAPGIRIQKESRGVQLMTESSNLGLYLAPLEKLNITTAEGEIDPISGWVCDGTRNFRTAAPQLSIKAEPSKSIRLVTLLMPTKHTEEEPDVTANQTGSSLESVEVTYNRRGQTLKDVVQLGEGIVPAKFFRRTNTLDTEIE